jgi:hypothetical protein
MAQITLNQVRVAKNGIVSFKTSTKRNAGTVYFDKKMFPNGAPQTLTITAEGIQEPIPDAPKAAPASAPTGVADTQHASAQDVAGI